MAEAACHPAGVAGAGAGAPSPLGHIYTRLAAGFGVGVARAHRYVTDLVDLLAREVEPPPRVLARR